LLLVLPSTLVLFLVGGCGGASVASNATGDREGSWEGGGTLTVLAAASLTDAFRELADDFERENPGVEVRTSFGASSALPAQMQQGAPADIFASADEEKMQTAADEGLLSGDPEPFVRNREVVVVPKSNPGNVRRFGDLDREGLRLVLAEDEVPAAEYAEEILSNADDDPEYGPRFRDAVLENVLSREADVRASVNRVVLGDADATFGYASDVTPGIREKVEVVPIPEDLNVVAEYPIAVVSTSENEDLAREWVEFVTSEEGQRVLEKWGFQGAA